MTGRPVISSIPLIGYADTMSVRPCGRIAFKVSSRLDGPYRADLVRIISGDPNPAGLGLIEHPVTATFAGEYPSRTQSISAGSYAMVDGIDAIGSLGQLALSAIIWPTTPEKGPQGVVTLIGTGGTRLALGITGAGQAALWDDGDAPLIQSEIRLRPRQWMRLSAAIDLASGTVELEVASLDASPGAAQRCQTAGLALPNAITPAKLYVAALDGAACSGLYNGKIEEPTLHAGLGDFTKPALALDFSRAIPTQFVEDTGPHSFTGKLVNLPTRAVTGSVWTGDEMCWRHAPADYAAIHFHDDDLGDCGWETDFVFDVPSDLPSGLYAAKLTGGAAVDRIPFIVPPPQGSRGADLCVVIPTFTYLIYGNHARIDFTDEMRQRIDAWGGFSWNPIDHPEFGLSTYNRHSDGSGISVASPQRPLLTLRPDFLSLLDPRGSGLRHLPADTHLLAWLAEKGIACDLITDHELHAEGASALDGYRAVLTATHPEYHTRETLDALTGYRDDGGRLAYLGGNGFYWRIAMQTEAPWALEVRRAEGGIRAWDAQPGEYWQAFDGAYGGLWRRNARPPQLLVGIGFSAQGLFEGAAYRRTPASHDNKFSWLFECIDSEVLGDFGFSGGGAAGFELDRVEPALGTSSEATVLASSFAHGDHFTPVYEDLLNHVTTAFGQAPDELVRADMIYWDTPSGGAVFSVGSITFCGSLPCSNFENDISRLLLNVLSRWLSEDC